MSSTLDDSKFLQEKYYIIYILYFHFFKKRV
jgi:hypothetical protein